MSFVSLTRAVEPIRPDVNHTFNSQKEEEIQELTKLSIQEVFVKLKDKDFIVNTDLLHKAIFNAFKDRRAEAIDHAMYYMKVPREEIIYGGSESRQKDFYIAKKTFQIFPHNAFRILSAFYNDSDNPIIKGNIIKTLGNLAEDQDSQAIRVLLMDALDDKTFCEEGYSKTFIEPLRICDAAYNQIVLRYKIKNVLRTIANTHKIEIRDYHINSLKKLKNSF